MLLTWSTRGWADYLYWQTQDRKMLRRVNDLLHDIDRGAVEGRPHEGIGKPEALKHGLRGYWSRCINDEHRLIYKVADDGVFIVSCRFHCRPQGLRSSRT